MARHVAPNERPDDDGRTIADMNIEGMPWHHKRPVAPMSGEHRQPASRRDALRAALYAGFAGFLIAACFLAAFALFILFCTNVWFR